MTDQDAAKLILVIGASSGIGLETTRLALERGFSVRALSRHASRMPLRHERLETIDGDALNRTDIDAALKGVGAVVQALGVPLTPQSIAHGTRLFSEATAVLLPAMHQAGVTRLVSVTGFGAGDSRRAIPLWQRPGFKVVFERIYDDKSVQERQIKESDLDWTIVRPTILTNAKRSGRYLVINSLQRFRSGFIARADVADFIVKSITEGGYIRQAPIVSR